MNYIVDFWADWLVDAVAMATQDRQFLIGEPEANNVAIEAIRLNGRKAIINAIDQLQAGTRPAQ